MSHSDSAALVSCQALTKNYGSTIALDSLDLTLNSGSPIALVGPNGAGKTTLLSLLCGYIRPSSGSVTISGHRPGSSALHGKLAALPQDAVLDPRFSVIRQLMHLARLQGMSAAEAESESMRALELVQLADSATTRPEELSHGMRKRVSIAQVLMGQPQLALLDEPTAGLDPPNVKIIRDVVTANADKTTFVISSHNLDEVEKLCETVVLLEKGKLRQHEQIAEITDDADYLTIRLSQVDASEFIAACGHLPGVTSVEQQQQGAFLIAYDAQSHPAMEIKLLEMMSQKGWAYKNLARGRSLEDRLFE